MAPILPPDYEPIPTPKERITEAVENVRNNAPKVVSAYGLSVTLYQLVSPAIPPYPVMQSVEKPAMQAIQQPQQVDDPPNKDYWSPVSYSLDTGVQTTSSDMPFNQHDWSIPQRRPSNAHLMMLPTNAALLFGSTSSDMPFNNYVGPVPGRQTLHSSKMMFSTSDALLAGNHLGKYFGPTQQS